MKEIKEEMDQSIKLDVDEWADKMDRYEEMEREMNKLKSDYEKMAKVIEELKAKLEAE